MRSRRSPTGRSHIKPGRPLIDPAQHRLESAQVLVAARQPLVPPGGASRAQWFQQLRRRVRITWRYTTQDHLEVARPLSALRPDVGDKLADLVNRWEIAVSGAGEQRHYSIP